MFADCHFVRLVASAMIASVMVTGCREPRAAQPPSIEFAVVPQASAGGSDRMAPIGGRVTGARPGQQIVLFAKSGVWWVQPLTAEPFTRIEQDFTWKSRTHLGTEYGALLVGPGYRPPHTVDLLPQPGGDVIAVATINGTADAAAAPKVLSFSGYQWEVRGVPSDRGGPNEYDSANAWVDADGFLHLKLALRDGRWTSAEVVLTRTLGYGTYAFTVKDVANLDPAAAFGMFSWDDQSAEQNHRELDIEISQWGDPKTPNGQYVVQPYYVPANVARFSVPAGTLTHSFRWEPGRASFRTVRGARADGAAVAQHEFTSGVPSPGAERVRMNLYFFRYAPAPPQRDVEVVIERFQFLP
jgi:hypothetical protein